MEHGQQHDATSRWMDTGSQYPHAQHHSPVHGYNGFVFDTLPMEPMYPQAIPPLSGAAQQQVQPLPVPQWPSLLTSQSTYAPQSARPVPILPTSTRSSSTPRKTLTDNDRRLMCQYHESNPNVKQTEIGAVFGVERSTVSKVLRQKEKFLCQDDEGRSQIKRSKGKFPDIERALSNWARNQQRQGLTLTDASIQEKAQFFAATVGSPEGQARVNDGAWLEMFKRKNNLMGTTEAQSPDGVSPASAVDVASPSSPSSSPSILLSPGKGEEMVGPSGPDARCEAPGGRHPLPHPQSNASFSVGPTSPARPFFTPDSAPGLGSPFMHSMGQTLGVDVYASPTPSSEAEAPRHAVAASAALDSPTSNSSLGGAEQTMQPPPLPSVAPVTAARQMSPISLDGGSASRPTREDARQALEVVMSFFQQQPSGFVEPQEYVMIGKLMEKLKLQRGVAASFPGGMHHTAEREFRR